MKNMNMSSTITLVVTRVLLISLLQTTSTLVDHVVEGLAASRNSGSPPPARLKQLLQSEMDGTRESDKPILLPCCYDGLTARLVARAGFDATFMTGFGVSAVNGAFENGYIIFYYTAISLRCGRLWCPIIRCIILPEVLRSLSFSQWYFFVLAIIIPIVINISIIIIVINNVQII
jgi:hypothetical protein